VTTFRIPAELTHHNAQDCVQQYLMVMKAQTGPVTIIDATGLQRFDSSALSVLLMVARNMKDWNGELHITGLPQRAKTLASVYGISDLLPL
jgi:phospholipid transport system transporter-binding protein